MSFEQDMDMNESKDLEIKDYFKAVLKRVLIENPPKRLTGNSGWLNDLFTSLAEKKIISGGVSACCEEWCEKEAPCGYQANLVYEKCTEELDKLIESL